MENVDNFGVAMYKGRLFLGVGDLMWGSSFTQQVLDFKLGTNDDGVAFQRN
jgi:hypothetical protein